MKHTISILVLFSILMSCAFAQPPGRTPEATAAQLAINSIGTEVQGLQTQINSLQSIINSGVVSTSTDTTNLKSLVASYQKTLNSKLVALGVQYNISRKWQNSIKAPPGQSSSRQFQATPIIPGATATYQHKDKNGKLDTSVFPVYMATYGTSISQNVMPAVAGQATKSPVRPHNYVTVEPDGKSVSIHYDWSTEPVVATDGVITLSVSVPVANISKP